MSTSRDPVFDTRFKPGFLHPRHWPTWISLLLLVVLAWFPVRLRDGFARSFAPLVIRFSKRQCNVARTNFRLCFPEQTEAEREALAQTREFYGLRR